MSRIYFCGLGIITSIGLGAQQNHDALLEGRCGISDNSLIDTVHRFPVGQVKLSNPQLLELLHLPTDKTISRTALLGAIAAQEAVADARIPAHKRIGIIS